MKCPHCHGAGSAEHVRCLRCRGIGEVRLDCECGEPAVMIRNERALCEACAEREDEDDSEK